MRWVIRLVFQVTTWAVCGVLFPFALMAFFFSPQKAVVGLLFVVCGFTVVTLFFRRWFRVPIKVLLFASEVVLIAVVFSYYTADRRPVECGFEPGENVKPLVVYADCRRFAAPERVRDCLRITSNPYDFAMFGGKLLVLSGRDVSTLGIIDPEHSEEFVAVPLGYGNAQEIVVDERRKQAVISMWKKKEIIVFDLKKLVPVRSYQTRVSKLLGADRFGDVVHVVSELPWIYSMNLKDGSIRETALSYRFHTLNGLRIDASRGKMYLSDWVWGRVYKVDLRTMKTEKMVSPGMVSTGIALDPGRCEVFVARTLSSKIDVFDCGTLRRKRSIRTGFGVNEVQLSDDGKTVYATRYFAGKFITIRRSDGKVLKVEHVGGQARGLLYVPEDNAVYVGTKCGVFSVEP